MKLILPTCPWAVVFVLFQIYLVSVTHGTDYRQGHFRVIPSLENYVVKDSALWVRGKVEGISRCTMMCLADVSCRSFFYNSVTGSCIGHSNLLTRTATTSAAPGSVYYERNIQSDPVTAALTTAASSTTTAATTLPTTTEALITTADRTTTETPPTAAITHSTTTTTTVTMPATTSIKTTTTTSTTTASILPITTITTSMTTTSSTTTTPTTATPTTTTLTTTTTTIATVPVTVTYIYHDYSKSWTDARAICKRNGGDMASLDTPERFDAVKRFFYERRKSRNNLANTVWVGINRNSADRRLYWTNGALMDESDVWASGYPKSGYDCGYTSPFSGMTYSNYHCTWEGKFLCQIPA